MAQGIQHRHAADDGVSMPGFVCRSAASRTNSPITVLPGCYGGCGVWTQGKLPTKLFF